MPVTSDRVVHLNARIDLDEVPLSPRVLGSVSDKHRPRRFVALVYKVRNAVLMQVPSNTLYNTNIFFSNSHPSNHLRLSKDSTPSLACYFYIRETVPRENHYGNPETNRRQPPQRKQIYRTPL